MRRTIRHFRVRDRIKRHDMAPTEPDDFDLELLGAGNKTPDFADSLAYCLDPGDRRLLYTVHKNTAELLGAPFVYLAQYRKATGAFAVPIEQLDSLEAPVERPLMLIYSIGRCGSTLLARLLDAAGQVCVSEPDPPSNLAYLELEELQALGSDAAQAVIRATAASILRHLEGSVAIKLRSQCVRLADDISAALPNARNVFLLRRALPWIRSNHLAFRWTPTTLVNKLHYSLAAYDRLAGGGRDCPLIWYEDLQARPAETLETLLGRDLTADERARAKAVLAQDAQAGTLYAQDRIEKRDLPTDFLARYRRDPRHQAAQVIAERHGFAERLYEGLAR